MDKIWATIIKAHIWRSNRSRKVSRRTLHGRRPMSFVMRSELSLKLQNAGRNIKGSSALQHSAVLIFKDPSKLKMPTELPVLRMSFPATISCWLLLSVLVAQGTTYGYGPAYGQAMDIAQFRDSCNFLCTVSPASQKCFRCKNRIPMRFGKRSSSSSTDTAVLRSVMPIAGVTLGSPQTNLDPSLLQPLPLSAAQSAFYRRTDLSMAAPSVELESMV